MKQVAERDAYALKEAAHRLSLGMTKLREELENNRLKSFWAGGKRLVTAVAIKDWIRDREAESQQADQ